MTNLITSEDEDALLDHGTNGEEHFEDSCDDDGASIGRMMRDLGRMYKIPKKMIFIWKRVKYLQM